MSKTVKGIIVGFVLVVALLGQNLSATKVAVGPSACQPSLVHFSTIQAAVNAVPFYTTILVCPGTYPEQIKISQPLTLQGVTDGTGNAAVITIPSGGLTVNAPTNWYGATAATHLLVESVGVTLSDLTLDGTGVGCVSGTYYVLGIQFYNVGTASDGTTAGKVQNVVVRNYKTGCYQSYGIVSDTSYITITNSELHDLDEAGIYTSGSTRNTIANNSLQNPGYYGIGSYSWGYNPVSTVFGNTVSGATGGGIVVGEANVSKNTVINNPNVGIWMYFAFSSVVTGNTVSNSQWPLELEYSCCNTVQNNTFNSAGADGIRDENSYCCNTVTRNMVNEAGFGIFTDSSVGSDTLVPNSLFNAVVTVDPGTNSSPGIPPTPTPPVKPY